jgi:hypothetical protein
MMNDTTQSRAFHDNQRATFIFLFSGRHWAMGDRRWGTVDKVVLERMTSLWGLISSIKTVDSGFANAGIHGIEWCCDSQTLHTYIPLLRGLQCQFKTPGEV